MKRWKAKGRKLQTKVDQKKAGIGILKLDKADFKVRRITRNQEGHFTKMKGLSQHNDIIMLNLCV